MLSVSVIRFILAALISHEISLTYQWEHNFSSLMTALLTLQSIPHEQMPFVPAVMIASDRIMGTVLGCMIGLASYIFLETLVLEDYFFLLVDLAIVLNISMCSYLYTSSRKMQMSIVSSPLILSKSFISENISEVVITYIFEIMMGVVVACLVYLFTLPLFYWQSRSHLHHTSS